MTFEGVIFLVRNKNFIYSVTNFGVEKCFTVGEVEFVA